MTDTEWALLANSIMAICLYNVHICVHSVHLLLIASVQEEAAATRRYGKPGLIPIRYSCRTTGSRPERGPPEN